MATIKNSTVELSTPANEQNALKIFIRRGLLALATASWLASCAGPNAFVKEEQEAAAQPVIVNEKPLLDDAADAVIASAAKVKDATRREQLGELAGALRKTSHAPFVAGNKVTPLIDGPAAFAAIDKAIAAAKDHIHVETYIFADDQLGRSFVDSLIRKREQGVEVRVIYDAIGSHDTPDSLFDEMRAAGIEVAEFRPLNPIKTLPWRYHNRDHRKLLIIDGRVAFTGGMNITGAYASGSKSRPGPDAGLTEAWRDTDVEIDGPAVEQFQTQFLDTWTRLGQSAGERQEKYFPQLYGVGDDLVAAVVSVGARQQHEAIYRTYVAAIEHASRRIWITQAYFAPPPEFRDALLAAVRRGVDVRIVLPGFTDSGLVFYASRAGYEALLRGGVRLFEKKDALLHAKTAVVDDALIIIGSANLDYRSFLHNNEVTAVIIGRGPTQKMQSSFEVDLQSASELTLQEWQHRSSAQKLKESLSTLFKYWL